MTFRNVDFLLQRTSHLLSNARILLAGLCLTAGGQLVHSQDAETPQKAPAQAAETKPAEGGSADANDPADANQGQADLDEAVIQRIDANTPQQLEAVSALLQSALTKGLDEENQSFAKKMLGSVQLQRSQGLAAAMVQARGRRQLELRDETLRSLEEAVLNDPTLVEAHLLIARLNLLPGGDRAAVKQATSNAIELLEDDPAEQSSALVLRALTQEDDDAKLADLDAAIKADPDNNEAYQARAAMRLQKNDVEGAVQDLEVVLLKDPTNQIVAGAAIQKLADMNRIDEAQELITKILAAKPSEGMYRMRAILYRNQGEDEKALSDLNKAIAMQPKDPLSLIMRAEVALDRKDISAAKADLKSAEELAPQLKESDKGIALRAQIAIAEERFVDAINDAKLLVERMPENVERHLFLANLYSLDKRPRKAIDVYTALLNDDPKNAVVLRARGDMLLSVGDHAAAVEDYETVVQSLGNIEEIEASDRQKLEAAGAYNNLSWVLATSPVDSVRDGKRALEYGEKAARLTDYKAPHILSTLAAAYAEAGDFEKAVQWSSKAVEIGSQDKDNQHEQLEQLKNELDSYNQGKPWREKQETEENTVPILAPEDLIDT